MVFGSLDSAPGAVKGNVAHIGRDEIGGAEVAVDDAVRAARLFLQT